MIPILPVCIHSQFPKKILLSLLLSLAACQTTETTPEIKNLEGQPTVIQDPGQQGLISGVGIQGNDIVSMTDKMVRDISVNTNLTQRDRPPRVIVDSAYFSNNSSQRLPKNQIVDRLRVGLQRAAKGRIAFLNREHAGMIEHERALKRAGEVDQGTAGLTRAQAGADYRLTGRITSLDSVQKDGLLQRYTQILFELTDLENGIVLWSDIYELSKAGQNDVIYR